MEQAPGSAPSPHSQSPAFPAEITNHTVAPLRFIHTRTGPLKGRRMHGCREGREAQSKRRVERIGQGRAHPPTCPLPGVLALTAPETANSLRFRRSTSTTSSAWGFQTPG